MIYIFDGEDRKKAEQKARMILGEKIEIIDADNISLAELESIFLGVTFFEAERRILIKDLFLKKDLVEKLPNLINTPHKIVLLETKLDKRGAVYKELVKLAKTNSEIKFETFAAAEQTVDRNAVFRIFDLAMTDGRRAVKNLQGIESDNDPYVTIGAWTKKACDLLERNPKKARAILKELAKIDVLVKSTDFSKEPWTLLEGLLLRIPNLWDFCTKKDLRRGLFTKQPFW